MNDGNFGRIIAEIQVIGFAIIVIGVKFILAIAVLVKKVRIQVFTVTIIANIELFISIIISLIATVFQLESNRILLFS